MELIIFAEEVKAMNISYGRRLKALRRGRGLTQDETFRLLGLAHRQSLAAIEGGSRSISAEEMVRAAAAFAVPIEYFTDRFVVAGEACFSWRKGGDVLSEDIAILEAKAGRLFGAYRSVRRELGQSPKRLNHETGLRYSSTEQDAARAGEAFGAETGLDACRTTDLATLAEVELGLPVLNLDTPRNLSGAACHLNDMDGIVLNRAEVPGRRNFNVAHELFHVLTWEHMPPEHVEEVGDDRGTGRRKHVENLADAFASSMLMPTRRLNALPQRGRPSGTIAALVEWMNTSATSLGVTSMALNNRLLKLGRIDVATAKALRRSSDITYNGATEVPPAPLPYSKQFVRTLLDGVERNRMSLQAAAGLVDLKVAGFEGVCREYGFVVPKFPNAEPNSAQWSMMMDNIAGWSNLAEGWDGDDSVAPSPRVINNALAFAVKVRESGASLPTLALYGDGEAEFRWKSGTASASVAFPDDDSIVAYVRASAQDMPLKLDHPDAGAADLSGLFADLRRVF